jgi:hypothetical protein
MHGATEDLFNRLAEARQKLLSARHEAARWITRTHAALAQVFGEEAEGAGVSDDARGSPRLELPVISVEDIGRETEAVEPARVGLKVVETLAPTGARHRV